MTDDQGWFDAGFNGNLTIKTPHLDQLAGQGVIFNRFYSASAVCSPTRASVRITSYNVCYTKLLRLINENKSLNIRVAAPDAGTNFTILNPSSIPFLY